MKIKPILHRLFVQPQDAHEADDLIKRAKALGIEIELDKREQKAVTIGIVLAVGSTAYKEFGSNAETEGIVPGTKIIYSKYSGCDVPNESYITINDEDVLGVYINE